MASVLAARQTVATRLAPSRVFARSHPLQSFSTTCRRTQDDSSKGPSISFKSMPSPPRLPKEEQEIFEQLQRQSTGAFSTPRTPPKVNQISGSGEKSQPADTQLSASGDELKHRDFQGRPAPDFEGDTNPETGEVGGPKNEPLRWGSEGDWSYGSRVTDF